MYSTPLAEVLAVLPPLSAEERTHLLALARHRPGRRAHTHRHRRAGPPRGNGLSDHDAQLGPRQSPAVAGPGARPLAH
jgi:hypothetical protein